MYENFNLTDGTPIKHVEIMCSSSHTYGNAIAFIENWLINLFPKDLFKTIHVNSRIAHQQIRNTPHEYNKRLKPIFAITPRVDFNDSRFLEGTMLTERMYDLYSNYGLTNLMPFFMDKENKFAIKYQLNRSVLFADVILVFSTKMQQINYGNYFKNITRVGKPQDLNTCFESHLAPELIETISKTIGIPIVDEDGTTKTFLNYLNSHSQFPISYKLQGGTSTREFYRMYPVKIDTLIDSFDIDEGEKSGFVTDNFKITFSVRMEFFSTGFYYLFSDHIVPVAQTDYSKNDVIVPTYTDVLLKEDFHLENGWELFTNVSFQLEKKDDEIAFDEVVNVSIKEAIKYHLNNGLPLVNLIDIKIRKQGNLLFENKDYTIDYKKLIVRFDDVNYNFYTYTMYISVNVLYLNNLLKELFNLK